MLNSITRVLVLILFMGFAVEAIADPEPLAQVTLAWDPSSSGDVAGYYLYQGISSGNYSNVIDVGNSTAIAVPGLIRGLQYCFAVSAYNAVGLESELSQEVCYTAPISTEPSLRISLRETEIVLEGRGPAGSKYDLLVSSDLQNWTTAGVLTVGSQGTIQNTQPRSPDQSPRFFRLRPASD